MGSPWQQRRIWPDSKKLLAGDYDISSTLDDLKRSIQRQGRNACASAWRRAAKTGEKGPAKLTKSIAVPGEDDLGGNIDADSTAPRNQAPARSLQGSGCRSHSR